VRIPVSLGGRNSGEFRYGELRARIVIERGSNKLAGYDACRLIIRPHYPFCRRGIAGLRRNSA
jgi:hypothetical protein